MRIQIQDFLKSETGAVTVDWVVLTAALVGLGLTVITTVQRGATDTSNSVGAHMNDMEISDYRKK